MEGWKCICYQKHVYSPLFLNILEDVSTDRCFYETLKISTITASINHKSWNTLLAFPILKIITSFLALPVSKWRGFTLVLCNTLHVSPQVINYVPNSQKSKSFLTKQHIKDHFLCLLKSVTKHLLSSKGTGSC